MEHIAGQIVTIIPYTHFGIIVPAGVTDQIAPLIPVTHRVAAGGEGETLVIRPRVVLP